MNVDFHLMLITVNRPVFNVKVKNSPEEKSITKICGQKNGNLESLVVGPWGGQ